jgi:hypothetical protein
MLKNETKKIHRTFKKYQNTSKRGFQMRFKVITLLLALTISLTGCVESKESKLTLDTVTKAIQAEGTELFSKGQISEEFAVLNNVKPNVFTIGNKTEDVAKLESVYVYIFDSEKERKDGLVTFNQHKELAKLTSYPLVYEQKNVLVIYWSPKDKDTKYGNKIQKALQKL